MIKANVKKIADSAKLKNNDISAKKIVVNDGAEIRGVRVSAPSLEIGANSVLTGTILLSNGAIKIGDSVQIKENSVLKAFKSIEVGDASIIDRGVIVAGLQSERSDFKLGSRCVILHHTYINNAREVIIGNNVGIGGYCMIFTHGVWQNVFKGYPYKFGKVEIQDDVWLPWHVFVMPGVTIGKGSTIAGGSVVTKDIPNHALAAGVPAKIIKQDNYPTQLALKEKDDLAKSVIKDFVRYCTFFLKDESTKFEGVPSKGAIISNSTGGFIYSADIKKIKNLSRVSQAMDLVAFNIPQHIKASWNWLDIESETRSPKLNQMTERFVDFLRRYGVRVFIE